METPLRVGDVLEHKMAPALGVIVGFHEWSKTSSYGHNVLMNWFLAPERLYFFHGPEMQPCHYDAGAEEYVVRDFTYVGHIELEGTDGSSSISR